MKKFKVLATYPVEIILDAENEQEASLAVLDLLPKRIVISTHKSIVSSEIESEIVIHEVEEEL